jgi:cyclophilin family peptidyl-prolyl cis-trans isomerase
MDDDCYLPGNVRAVPRATVQTTKGAFEAVLYEDDAPNTVANFIEIAERGFCDGLNFHRVLPGLVIQSGDPEGTGSGGPGYTIEDEVNGRKHVAGAVGMAKTARPNSAGSQFSICIDEAPHLNAGYTVFGAVTKGMDVVRAISKDDAIVRICVADRRDHGYRAWKRFPPGSDGPSAEGQPPR